MTLQPTNIGPCSVIWCGQVRLCLVVFRVRTIHTFYPVGINCLYAPVYGYGCVYGEIYSNVSPLTLGRKKGLHQTLETERASWLYNPTGKDSKATQGPSPPKFVPMNADLSLLKQRSVPLRRWKAVCVGPPPLASPCPASRSLCFQCKQVSTNKDSAKKSNVLLSGKFPPCQKHCPPFLRRWNDC